MKKINQELIALFDKYGSDRRQALRENKKLSYLYALADLRENLLDWCQFDPEQQALQIGADAGALTGLLARRLSSVTVLDASEENLEVVRRRFQTEPELAGMRVLQKGNRLSITPVEKEEFALIVRNLL